MRTSGFRPSSLRAILRHDKQSGGADVQRTGVAGRHRAAFRHERRLQRRQRLEAGVAADALIFVYDLATPFLVAAPRRNDFLGKEAGIRRFRGVLMAAQSELVLFLAADAVAHGQVLSRQTHLHRGGAVMIKEARAGVETRFHGDMLHVLNAAGDLNILTVGGDALCCLIDGLKAGTAIAVDGDAGHLDGQTGNKRGHVGNIITLLALLLDAAPYHVLNGSAGNADAIHERPHEVRRQVVGAHIAEDALFWVSAANGRSHGVNHDGVTHDALLRKIDSIPTSLL